MVSASNGESNEAEVLNEPSAWEVDWYLQELVNFANEGGIEFGLTLFLGGCVVSGTLISGKTYFEEFARGFSEACSGANQSEIYEALASRGEIYERTADDEPLPAPGYVHLKDARMFSPSGSLPDNQAVLWRGRIGAVAGFSLGLLSRGP